MNKNKWIVAIVVLIVGAAVLTAFVWPRPETAAAGLFYDFPSELDPLLFEMELQPGRLKQAIDYEGLLAAELGVTVDELQVAREAAFAAAVNQALDEGLITDEQAQLALAASQLRGFIEPKALLAEGLGMTIEELEAAQTLGTRLPELIEQQGLDYATVRDNLIAARAAAIEDAVVQGIVTREQAELLLERPRFGWNSGRFHR